MERFRDVVHHTHKLAVHGRWLHALHDEVTNGPCSVTQAKRKRCQGALGQDCQGEQFFARKLCHDIDKRKGEAAQILPGWLGSQEDAELTLQPLVVEIGEPSAL
jgi:hypothetical protein